MHASIMNTSGGPAGAVLANVEQLFPLPSSGGYDRLHTCWRKRVTGLDKTKTNGYSLLGDFLKDGPQWLPPGLYLASAWRGSVKNQKPYYTLYQLLSDGEVLTLAEVGPQKDWAVKLWPTIEAVLAAKESFRCPDKAYVLELYSLFDKLARTAAGDNDLADQLERKFAECLSEKEREEGRAA